MPDDPNNLDAIARPHATVADKIRALAAAGVPRADIARFLGKRYQHVRNVLEGDAQTKSGGSSDDRPPASYVLGRADLTGVEDPGSKFESASDERPWIERRGHNTYWLRPRPDGSLILPREVAQALGLTEGRRVRARFRDDELQIVSGKRSMEEAQALVLKHIKPEPGVSIVDEFVAEKRAIWGEDD